MSNNLHSRIHKFVSNAHKNQITPHNWLSTYQPDESVVEHNNKVTKQREITYNLPRLLRDNAPRRERETSMAKQDLFTPERAAEIERDYIMGAHAYCVITLPEGRKERALDAQRQLEKDLALQRWYEEAMLDSWELACDSMDDDIVTLSAMAHTLKELGQ